jgi:hypothetical protein
VVQELLGISRATLWRIVRSGSLPVVYIDGRPRFLVSDVERLIESRRMRATAAESGFTHISKLIGDEFERLGRSEDAA